LLRLVEAAQGLPRISIARAGSNRFLAMTEHPATLHRLRRGHENK
jgi:hypothetical protein